MKVRVQEYRDRIFELPDNHFEDEDGDYFDDLSDCEIANEFITKGKLLYENSEYQDDPYSWDTKVFNHETNKWEEVSDDKD